MFQTIYQMRNDRSLFARMRSVRGLPHCTRLWSPYVAEQKQRNSFLICLSNRLFSNPRLSQTILNHILPSHKIWSVTIFILHEWPYLGLPALALEVHRHLQVAVFRGTCWWLNGKIMKNPRHNCHNPGDPNLAPEHRAPATVAPRQIHGGAAQILRRAFWWGSYRKGHEHWPSSSADVSHAEWACHLTSQCAGTSLGGSMAARLSSQSWKEWDVQQNGPGWDANRESTTTTPALLRWSAMPGRADGSPPHPLGAYQREAIPLCPKLRACGCTHRIHVWYIW